MCIILYYYIILHPIKGGTIPHPPKFPLGSGTPKSVSWPVTSLDLTGSGSGCLQMRKRHRSYREHNWSNDLFVLWCSYDVWSVLFMLQFDTIWTKMKPRFWSLVTLVWAPDTQWQISKELPIQDQASPWSLSWDWGMGETIQQTRDFDHEVPWHSPKRWVVNTKNGWSTLKWVDGFCLQNIVLRHFACFLFSNRNGQWQASLWGANGTLCTAQAYLQAKAQKNCSNAETNREPEIQKGKIGKLAVAHALAVSRGYQLLKFKLQGLQLQRSHFHVIVSIQRHSLTLSPPLKCPLARLDARHHCCHS